MTLLLVVGGGGCGWEGLGRDDRNGRASAGAAPAPPPPIQAHPANGARDVPPDQPVVVTAVRGTLQHVTVQELAETPGGTPGKAARKATGKATAAAKSVEAPAGRFSADRRVWRTRWALRPGATYTVTATGTGAAGEPTSLVSRFTTLEPERTFRIADVTPRDGETVGVGMPLIVTFDRAVTRRASVEKALELRVSRRVTGAWYWTGPRQVVFRPRGYWPAGQRVTLRARTAGVQAAKGVYGRSGLVHRFRVGPRRISTVDVRRHRMVVQENGVTVRTAPISAGKGGRRAFTTTSGIHLAMGKSDPIIMTSRWMGVTDPDDPRYYRKRVRHAVQISASGEYVHGAPWSVKSQGRENVSHGCVNTSPAFAEWFYARTLRGDVINVTGTDRPLEPFNGWGFWQIPWKQWVKGSALDRPVKPAREPAPRSRAGAQ